MHCVCVCVCVCVVFKHSLSVALMSGMAACWSRDVLSGAESLLYCKRYYNIVNVKVLLALARLLILIPIYLIPYVGEIFSFK